MRAVLVIVTGNENDCETERDFDRAADGVPVRMEALSMDEIDMVCDFDIPCEYDSDTVLVLRAAAGSTISSSSRGTTIRKQQGGPSKGIEGRAANDCNCRDIIPRTE